MIATEIALIARTMGFFDCAQNDINCAGAKIKVDLYHKKYHKKKQSIVNSRLFLCISCKVKSKNPTIQ